MYERHLLAPLLFSLAPQWPSSFFILESPLFVSLSTTMSQTAALLNLNLGFEQLTAFVIQGFDYFILD